MVKGENEIMAKRKCPKCPPLPKSFYYDTLPERGGLIIMIVVVTIIVACIVGLVNV